MKKPQLIKSTSGIRGVVGNGLDPVIVAAYGAAFGTLLKKGTVVLGSDSRPSGEMVRRAVTSGLMSVGIDVIDIGIVPTPTVEIAVKALHAAGGICVTASHNPAPWNALKFFNRTGEFITSAEYERLSRIFESGKFAYQPVESLGGLETQDHWVAEHVKLTLAHCSPADKRIAQARFKVVVDAINGAGSVALPMLLEELGVEVIRINCKADGDFVHEPEPTPKNLGQLCRAVTKHKADLGMACDPDADRLALVDDLGQPVIEEATLTIAVKEVLRVRHGITVINLSTSSMTADTARALGSKVVYSKVGESNVVAMMHKTGAVVGGEGNGGVIYPSFHSGRDSLIAAALVLSHLAHSQKSLSELVGTLPRYFTTKSKAKLPDDFDSRLSRLEKVAGELVGKVKIDRRDGLRFDFQQGWFQLRRSNTEPIYRLIVETTSEKLTSALQRRIARLFK
jgi:phosphomannomutase